MIVEPAAKASEATIRKHLELKIPLKKRRSYHVDRNILGYVRIIIKKPWPFGRVVTFVLPDDKNIINTAEAVVLRVVDQEGLHRD